MFNVIVIGYVVGLGYLFLGYVSKAKANGMTVLAWYY